MDFLTLDNPRTIFFSKVDVTFFIIPILIYFFIWWGQQLTGTKINIKIKTQIKRPNLTQWVHLLKDCCNF